MCVGVIALWEWVILSRLNNDMHHALQNNHVLVYTQCHLSVHNSLQFSSRGQIHTGPRGTSSLGGYHLQLHSEGMSYHPHLPQASSLQRGATGTPHNRGNHDRQRSEGQWMNPVNMISIMSGMLY